MHCRLLLRSVPVREGIPASGLLAADVALLQEAHDLPPSRVAAALGVCARGDAGQRRGDPRPVPAAAAAAAAQPAGRGGAADVAAAAGAAGLAARQSSTP